MVAHNIPNRVPTLIVIVGVPHLWLHTTKHEKIITNTPLLVYRICGCTQLYVNTAETAWYVGAPHFMVAHNLLLTSMSSNRLLVRRILWLHTTRSPLANNLGVIVGALHFAVARNYKVTVNKIVNIVDAPHLWLHTTEGIREFPRTELLVRRILWLHTTE